LVKLSVDQVLMKARSHVKKNWMIKAKKLYELVVSSEEDYVEKATNLGINYN
jgi:predicted O-linked N-acetylglucosamine transferase (SPINDLY family)